MKISKEWRFRGGIYKIYNSVNGKFYIGSSSELYNRLCTYKCLFRRGEVHNKHLQASFNKYGIENFHIEILEFCNKNIEEREQYWIDLLKPQYNKRKKVDLNLQISPSKETRDKISKSLKEAFLKGEKRIDRVQAHSIKVSLFDLDGNFIQRFDSVGLLKEFIGSKNCNLARYAKNNHKYKNWLIYLTTDEDKVKPHSELKKQRYAANGIKLRELWESGKHKRYKATTSS